MSNTPAIPEEVRRQIEELQKSNAAYRRAWELAKGFKESAENKAAQNQWARDSLESEREMNHILTKEISTLEATIQEQDKQIIEKGKEIERLTKLVHEAFSKFRYRSFPHNEPTWEQFAKENNIQL